MVGYRTESQDPAGASELDRYLATALTPLLESIGFVCERFANSVPGAGPFLIAKRIEPGAERTVFTYGHGDVVRGYADAWFEGLTPWKLKVRDGRWYGRGSADNKGQHLINLQALTQVLSEEGKLGFNVVALFEMAEERGSPGLRAFCEEHRDELQADFLIASDGPRLSADRPTLFMGSRGLMNLDLILEFREGGHHSGNWGGLLANPGIVLAHALASLTDAKGRIMVDGWRAEPIPEAIRAAVADLSVGGGPNDPETDPTWGEPGLTPGEQVFAWNSVEVLAMICGNPEAPANAVPPSARARVHIRFVPPLEPAEIVPALRAHLDKRGFQAVQIEAGDSMRPTRLVPDHPLVAWAAASLQETTDQAPVLLPNLAGSLPNDVFTEVLGLSTLWVPHSYPACSQHAPNEHVLPEVMEEGLAIMAGLFWDLGNAPPATLS